MAPRDPEETGKMLRLERASVGVQAIAGIALLVIGALVTDVRASIATLNARVEAAIRSVAILEAQNLDAHVRDLERRMSSVEAQAQKGKNP